MENVRGSHNSIPLSKLHSHSFHSSKKNTSIPTGQGQMVLGSPLGSPLAPHGRVTFPSSWWELVPITSKANSHICAPVHFLVLVRGLWHSPSPVPGTDTKPLVWGDSYTWRKVVTSLLSGHSSSPEHLHKDCLTVWKDSQLCLTQVLFTITGDLHLRNGSLF